MGLSFPALKTCGPFQVSLSGAGSLTPVLPQQDSADPPPLPAVSLCLQAGWLKSESAPESWAWTGAEVFVALWQGSSVLGGFEIAK